MKKTMFSSFFFLLVLSLLPLAAQPYVSFKVQPSERYDTIRPIWEGIDWFFPFFAFNAQGEPNTWYRETQPFINNVLIVTITGGRPAYPEWEILRKDNDGNYYYDFTMYDSCLDATLELGYLPTVNFMAIPLVLGPENPNIGGMGWITDPPVDYDKWYEFSKKVMTHTIERYGKDVVKKWYWRLSGEPDNTISWTGTKDEYYKLYDYWSNALRSAFPQAKVMPGNILGEMEDNWGIEILSHILGGTNYYTGKKGSPINAFTFSAYESCEKEFPPLYFFYQRVQRIQDTLEHYGALDSVEIGIDEGQLLLDSDGAYLWGGEGSQYGAAWQAAYQIFGIKTGLFRIFQWNFTSDGVKTPKYNVIEMLEKMKGDQRICMEPVEDTRSTVIAVYNNIDGIATINDTSRKIRILVFNHYKYRSANIGYIDSTLVKIQIDKLPFDAKKVYIRQWLVDKNHSNFFTQWLEDSKDIPRVDRGGWKSSIYDAEVLGTLDQDGKNFWYAHKNGYLQIDDLDSLGSDNVLLVQEDGSVSLDIYLHSQQVSLLEITADTLQTGIRDINAAKGSGPLYLKIYPNPFTWQTHITFSLDKSTNLLAEIFNSQGKLIRTLLNGHLPAGEHEIIWDGTNTDHASVPPGVYFIKMRTRENSKVRRVILTNK